MKKLMAKIKEIIVRYFPAFKGMFNKQGSELAVTPTNVVHMSSIKKEPATKSITTRETEFLNSSVSMVVKQKKASRKKTESNKNDNSKEEQKMPEHENHDHDHDKHRKDCCCEPVVIPVVIKVFDFCGEKYYYLKKFEEYIAEYYDLYPTVLFKFKKEYCDYKHDHDHDHDDDHKHKKCRVRFCVYFSLLDYEKAFEIETNLQKKYRHILLKH